ncbi:hypothetical protein ACS7SF_27490 (plasmid) [Ralstonia sp. 25C]|uniref:hypothetical protein n=1 Tax=Ralstonia sp. 25C TaxID=3447363 RepID=UPI003F756688
MSNNGDLKQEGPPTLFNSQPETDEAGHTRILASLEGRVGANCKASKKSRRRRYGVAAAVVLLLAGAGTWVALNQDGEPALPVAEHAAPAKQTPATEAAHAAATAPTPVAPATSTTTTTSSAEPPQAATIVNVAPPEEHASASDKASKDAAHEKSVASTLDQNEQVVTVKSGNTDAAKAETAKLVAKSTDTSIKPVQTKAKPQSAAKPGKPRKGGLAADDPDADLLAALLSPQNATKPANQPKGQ